MVPRLGHSVVLSLEGEGEVMKDRAHAERAVAMIKDLDKRLRMEVAKTLIEGKMAELPLSVTMSVVMATLDFSVPRIVSTLAANCTNPDEITKTAFDMMEKSISGMRKEMPDAIADTITAVENPLTRVINSAMFAAAGAAARPAEPDIQPGAPNPKSPWRA